jgi:hypothetical protein
MNDTTTPADLSREFSVDAKRMQAFLREQYGLLPPHETRWYLTLEQAQADRYWIGPSFSKS